MKYLTYWTLLATLAVSSGCSTVGKDWKKWQLPWSSASKIKSSEYGTPSKMVAIWTPDILAQPGKPATRGFGGRIYFYNDKSQAMPVEGQLVVYAYDDTADPHQAGQPQRKFAFTPDQFTQHFSNSELGASYSVWLPWDAVGGPQAHISLVPIFTATSGQIVMGQQAANVLPGLKPSSELPEQQGPQLSYLANRGVQQVAHRQAHTQQRDAATFAGATSTAAPEQRMRSSTIRLTPSLQRRILENQSVPDLAAPQATPAAAAPTAPPVSNPTEIPMYQAPQAPAAAAGAAVPPTAHSAHPQFRVRGGLAGRPMQPAPWTPPYPAALPSAPRSTSSLPSTTGHQAAW